MKNCSALKLARKREGEGKQKEGEERDNQRIYLFIQKFTMYLPYDKFLCWVLFIKKSEIFL